MMNVFQNIDLLAGTFLSPIVGAAWVVGDHSFSVSTLPTAALHSTAASLNYYKES